MLQVGKDPEAFHAKDEWVALEEKRAKSELERVTTELKEMDKGAAPMIFRR